MRILTRVRMLLDSESLHAALIRSIIVLAIVALPAVGLEGAHAGTRRYSQGDAEAVLSAYPTGGGAIFTHAPHVNAGPSRAYPQDKLSIRPIAPFFSDARYCAEDWHAIAGAGIDFEFVVDFEEPFIYTRDDALFFLGGIEMQFFLDGVLVEETREGPIQPYLDRNFLDAIEADLEAEFGAEVTIGDAWAVQAGRAVAPEELSIGAHTLSGIVTHAELGLFFDDGVTFYVDPPDSETCTGH